MLGYNTDGTSEYSWPVIFAKVPRSWNSQNKGREQKYGFYSMELLHACLHSNCIMANHLLRIRLVDTGLRADITAHNFLFVLTLCLCF